MELSNYQKHKEYYDEYHRKLRQTPERKAYMRAYRKKWRLSHHNTVERTEEFKAKQREAVARWRKNNPIQNRLHARARKLKTRNKIVKEEIGNWESRICGICSKFIEGNFHFDHIIPLSRGGEHTAKNLQLAHPYCNQSKFTKLPEEMSVLI